MLGIDTDRFENLCRHFLSELFYVYRDSDCLNLNEYRTSLVRVCERYPVLLGIWKLPMNKDEFIDLYWQIQQRGKIFIHSSFENVLRDEKGCLKWWHSPELSQCQEVVAVTPRELGADEWWIINDWIPRAKVMEYLVHLAQRKGLHPFSPSAILKFCQMYSTNKKCWLDLATTVHHDYNDVRVQTQETQKSTLQIKGFATVQCCQGGRLELRLYPADGYIVKPDKPILFLRRIK